MLATPPWMPYLAAALKTVKPAARIVPRTVAEQFSEARTARPPSPAGPRAGKMTKQGFLDSGGVYGAGMAGGIPSLIKQRGPAIAPGFDLL